MVKFNATRTGAPRTFEISLQIYRAVEHLCLRGEWEGEKEKEYASDASCK